ncbi:hypothetical protein DB88DRAFT_478214 [Papiliotrema laurentii]|uniref:Transglutaminase-like domain-containing protein n=1 Tax=Papiliotrema laurentii TaxID=5418 RepID=A0AAD9FWG1_PAPLA|nr:hypothetical protein DB88DRAFT_478214 [Papiliotrema laurentii]
MSSTRPRAALSQAQLNPFVLGWVAYGLRKGIYPTLLSVNLGPPTDPLVYQLLVEDMAGLVWLHAPRLYSYALASTRTRGPYAGRHQDMYATLRNLGKHAVPLDPLLRDKILAVLPDLSADVEGLLRNPPFEPFGQEDAQTLALARWFKHQFMAWRDPILCSLCQNRTEPVGSDELTDQEKRDGGGRVELHRCLDVMCAQVERFVRYNDPLTLLRTRTGRCGEWAHLFYEILRAVGLNARYVWNSEDHVWTEYWSPASQHWVHVDSCEATVGKPLLYARGWGKKQAFCIAAGLEGVEDVTRAYVDDWDDCLGRRADRHWNEEALAQALFEATLRLRISMSREEILACEERDRLHKSWVVNEPRRWREAERDELRGRTSGPADWRAARAELGASPKIVKPSYRAQRTIHSGLAPSAISCQGDATLSDAGVVLTTRGDQVGAAFASARIPQSTSWRAVMTFRLSAPPGSQGADGIALVFLSEPRMGQGGFGLGYTQQDLRAGDFAVEVDTFQSYDFADDPPVPHVSVHSPPHAHHRYSIACSRAACLPPLSDGREHSLEVVYDGSRRKLQGWLKAAGDAEAYDLWETEIPSPAQGDEAYWHIGVTGSTGGLWQKQEVLSLTVEEISIGGFGAMSLDDT